MILTLEEKRHIAKYVIYSRHGLFLNEAIHNNSIRNEIKLNFKFYNLIKESFFKKNHNVINEDLLSALGAIKDLLTGVDVVNKIVKWISEKFIPKLTSTLFSLIPIDTSNIENFINNAGVYVKKFIEWLKDNLSYHGLAKLLATIKYKSLDVDASKVKCLQTAAKILYRYVLLTLVTSFILKIIPMGDDAINMLLTQDTTDLQILFNQAGLGQFFVILFGAYGTATKAQKANKLKKEISKIKAENEILGFKDAWNKCG